MSLDQIDAVALSAATARKEMAILRAVLTGRTASRALSKNDMRRQMKELFKIVDTILGSVDELVTALSQPADADEADLTI